MQWYYAIDDQRLGPVSHAEFERLVQAGTITRDALVWRQGMDQWKTLAAVQERDPALFTIAPPPLPGLPTTKAETEAEPLPRRADSFNGGTEDQAAPEALIYAGFWKRFGAHVTDLFLWWFVWQLLTGAVAAVYFPEAMAIAQKGQGYQPKPEELMILVRFLGAALAIGLIWAMIYDALFIRRFSATPGKLLFGLRVVRAGGQPLGFSQIVVRCLAKSFLGLPTLFIGYLIVAFDEQKRSLHDYVSQTRVVKKRVP